MKNELNILGSAMLYFSRIPVLFKVPYSKEAMSKILTWFPFVGLLVGGLGALSWWGLSLVLPQALAIVLSMVVTILLTGAFHEDGFSDVCDGFGGGYGKEKILLIMKDSAVGAYGAIGMIMMLLIKFLALSNVDTSSLFVVIIIAHTVSRGAVLFLTQFWQYARSEDSKAKAPSQKLPWGRFVVALLFAFGPLCLVPVLSYWFIPFLAIATVLLMGVFFKKHIGGYTGDCLGAAQQVAEVVIYLSFIVLH